MTEIWRLVIEKDNTQLVTIFGTEEVLRGAQDDWAAWCNSDDLQEKRDADGLHAKVINGITDSADRAANRLVYRFCDVIGMSLTLITR